MKELMEKKEWCDFSTAIVRPLLTLMWTFRWRFKLKWKSYSMWRVSQMLSMISDRHNANALLENLLYGNSVAFPKKQYKTAK